MKKRGFTDRALSRKRMGVVIGLLTVLLAVLAVRLSYIMMVLILIKMF